MEVVYYKNDLRMEETLEVEFDFRDKLKSIEDMVRQAREKLEDWLKKNGISHSDLDYDPDIYFQVRMAYKIQSVVFDVTRITQEESDEKYNAVFKRMLRLVDE